MMKKISLLLAVIGVGSMVGAAGQAATGSSTAGLLGPIEGEAMAVISHPDFYPLFRQAQKENPNPLLIEEGVFYLPQNGHGTAGVILFEISPTEDTTRPCGGHGSVGEILADITYGGKTGREIMQVSHLRYSRYENQSARQCAATLESSIPANFFPGH